MTTFFEIYDKLADGTVGQWLAIVGVISLIYWGWRIVAALQHRQDSPPQVVAPEAFVPPAPPVAQSGPPAEDIAVIAAAVQAALGTGRIVHLEPSRGERTWANEGRWMQQTSHRPR